MMGIDLISRNQWNIKQVLNFNSKTVFPRDENTYFKILIKSWYLKRVHSGSSFLLWNIICKIIRYYLHLFWSWTMIINIIVHCNCCLYIQYDIYRTWNSHEMDNSYWFILNFWLHFRYWIWSIIKKCNIRYSQVST